MYVTLNPVDPQLLSRYNNRIESFAQSTTTDKQVTRRRWLLVDIDPVRPSGTSATDAQLGAAKAKARAVYGYLNGIGWAAPLVAESGNGMHLLYAIDLPNDDDATALVKAVLIELGERFDDAQTKVDRAVFNAARICKLYGTLANKGDHTAAAPWRLSKLLQTPARAVVTPEQLHDLIPATTASTAPTAAAPTRQSGGFNLEDFLSRHGLACTTDRHDGSERFKLEACPFNPEHGNGEAAIFRKASGALGFKCQHDSCSAKAWGDVRDLLDGPRPASATERNKTQRGEAFPPLKDDAACTWPELQPLIAQITPEEYPLDALPDSVRCAVQEVAGFVKAPIPLIATSALAALSLAIQAHSDVERADKLSGPCGLFLLAIADSGERKSTCDGFFTKSIRDYEARKQEAAKPLITAFKSEHEAWEAQRSGLKEKIKALAKDGKSSTVQAQDLRNLDEDEPAAPRVPRLIYGDATPEALTYALAKQWPSGGVISSEAGSVFGSHGMGKDSVMRNLAALNQLWDGTALPVERRSSESFTVRGARLTMALQVQETTIRAFFDSTKGLARGTGFTQRVLGKLARHKDLVVINDEAHHAYRTPADFKLSKAVAEERGDDLEQATRWVEGLDRIHKTRRIARCFDLSATPFAPTGRTNTEAGLFSWVVSDFGLNDAIEAGLVKTPRVVVRDDALPNAQTLRPKLYHLYREAEVAEDLNRKAEPHEALPALVQQAYTLLGADWRATAADWAAQGHLSPPVMLTVCNRTETAARVEHFFTKGHAHWPELHDAARTFRVDSKVLEKAELGEKASAARIADASGEGALISLWIWVTAVITAALQSAPGTAPHRAGWAGSAPAPSVRPKSFLRFRVLPCGAGGAP
ncbi:MAG: YfjI family protein [Burkholderiaceae bacterium]|nr:YfjI family protein [Burkholderiaceae bacterium]